MTPIKQYMFFNYFKEILEIFGQTEVGCNEVDIEALATYLLSDKFLADSFNYNTEDEAKEFITNLILEGFPVWQYLKCSDWTKNMVEKWHISSIYTKGDTKTYLQTRANVI